MSWYIASAALLMLATVAAGGTAARWPKARRDVLTALSTGAAVAFWLVLNVTHPGPTLLGLTDARGLTLADLAALPALAGAGLLMGRTVILARRRALTEEQEGARLASERAATPAVVENSGHESDPGDVAAEQVTAGPTENGGNGATG